MRNVLRHLRAAALLHAAADLSDGQLLEAFLARREEPAFKALLQRHGPMVLGVCRRVLGNCHDAEDAFQATFLVLLRKAASIHPREGVGNWLHGVAYRTALKARTMNAKRRTKERHAGAMPRRATPRETPSEELLAHLDAELNQLAEKYRLPIVLCDLEGQSRVAAARRLGWPVGTVSWRLAQGRKMLAQRLARHRVSLATSAVYAVLTHEALSASVPPSLLHSATRSALQLVTGESLLAGAVPAQVMTLTEGVLKAMLLAKLKITVWVAAFTLLAGAGLAGLTFRVAAQEPRQTPFRPALASGLQPSGTTLQPSGTTRQAPDDLESFRLELDALRKELRATRERVKALEGEMSALKGRGARGSMGADTLRGDGRPVRESADSVPRGDKPLIRNGATSNQPFGNTGSAPRTASDPLADAEKALKRLKQNPDDRQAADALEAALQRLKKREKPRAPAESVPELSR